MRAAAAGGLASSRAAIPLRRRAKSAATSKASPAARPRSRSRASASRTAAHPSRARARERSDSALRPSGRECGGWAGQLPWLATRASPPAVAVGARSNPLVQRPTGTGSYLVANALAAAIPQILAQGLLALRQQAIMPRLVNAAYSDIAGDKGTSIDVPIPSAVATRAVVAAAVPPQAADLGPTKVNIPMDQWIEAPFQLSDKDALEAMAGVFPMQASETINSLPNYADQFLLQLPDDSETGGPAAAVQLVSNLAA